jgi:peptidoglycan/LPS O-acetylase OafA/YrhL
MAALQPSLGDTSATEAEANSVSRMNLFRHRQTETEPEPDSSSPALPTHFVTASSVNSNHHDNNQTTHASREKPTAAAAAAAFPTSSFRGDIEGARGLAIILVVLYHADIAMLAGGFIGVDVFYVMSGFVITRVVLKEIRETKDLSVSLFVARRIRRLLPASALVLISTIILGFFILGPLALQRLLSDAQAVSMYWANMHFAMSGQDYWHTTDDPSPLLHYWSLAVEEQFYIVWPLIMLVFRASPGKRQAFLVFVAVISFYLSYTLTYTSLQLAFYSLPARAWEMICGALVAEWNGHVIKLPATLRAWMSGLGLFAILACALTYSGTTIFPGVSVIVPVAATVGLLCGDDSMAPGKLLGTPWMRWFGAISYSLYLWHWPAIVYATLLMSGSPFNASVFAGLLGAVGCLPVAILCYRFVEDPIRSSKSLTTKRTLIMGLLISCSCLTFTWTSRLFLPPLVGQGPPAQAHRVSRLQDFHQVLENASHLEQVPVNLFPPVDQPLSDLFQIPSCMFSSENQPSLEYLFSKCVMGDTTSAVTVFLVGDSHAGHWVPVIDILAKANHWRLHIFYMGNCPGIYTAVNSGANNDMKHVETCDKLHALVEEQAEKLRPIFIFFSHYYGQPPADRALSSTEAIEAGYTRLLPRLLDLKIFPIIIGDTPSCNLAFPTCLSKHMDSANQCGCSREQGVKQKFIDLEQKLATKFKVAFIDSTELFCGLTFCPAVVGNLITIIDMTHAGKTYMELVAPLFSELLQLSLSGKVSSEHLRAQFTWAT